MLIRAFLILFVFLQTVYAQSLEEEKKQNNSNSNSNIAVCDASIAFLSNAELKKQELALSSTVSMTLSQYLALKSSKSGAKVATNVICQTLKGASYTGSKEEWAQFIQQASNGMKNSGGKNMRLELVGAKERVFYLPFSHKEYRFYGEFNGIKQAIYNVAILDKKQNTVYTISVSGAEKAEIEIKAEFKRAVNSFKLPNS